MSTPDPTTLPPQPQITLRAPTTSPSTTATLTAFTPPPLPWLLGTWHVTHSTLPIWKKARNVSITYKPLASSPEKLDDLVTYQSLGGDKLKTVSGTDTPAGPGAWNWRGNGWLMIASSHWEVLGYGDVKDGEGDEEQWVVTYFAKTLFTPAGIDIYSRRKEGLKESTLQAVKEALGKVDAEVVRGLVGSIFEVKSD
jgi:hypothetical protein